jgi:hypothetical protein
VEGVFSRTDSYAISKAAWPKPPAHRRTRPPALLPSAGGDPPALPPPGDAPEALADAPPPPPPEVLERLGAHTYGEVDARGFADMLAVVRPREGEVFVDLGSGTGKVRRALSSPPLPSLPKGKVRARPRSPICALPCPPLPSPLLPPLLSLQLPRGGLPDSDG